MPCYSNNLVDEGSPRKPHNVVATTEEGRRLPFPVLQEIYEAYFWFFKRYRNTNPKLVYPKYFESLVILGFDNFIWITGTGTFLIL